MTPGLGSPIRMTWAAMVAVRLSAALEKSMTRSSETTGRRRILRRMSMSEIAGQNLDSVAEALLIPLYMRASDLVPQVQPAARLELGWWKPDRI